MWGAKHHICKAHKKTKKDTHFEYPFLFLQGSYTAIVLQI